MGLLELKKNKSARVASLEGPGMERVAAMGFTSGAKLRMIRNSGKGPVIGYLRQTEGALGRSAAKGILIEGAEQ
jgi:Fe2+ transport system protein FeoA